MEWTKRLPEDQRDAFIVDVLDAYRSLAADGPHEAHTFKFCQMAILLSLETSR